MNAHCAFRHVRDGGAAKVERRLERLRAFQVLQPHEDRQLCQGVARNRRTRGQRHRRSQRRLGAGRLVRGPGRHRLRRSHDRALRARFRRTAADQVQSMPKGGLFRIGSSVMGDPGALIELASGSRGRAATTGPSAISRLRTRSCCSTSCPPTRRDSSGASANAPDPVEDPCAPDTASRQSSISTWWTCSAARWGA